MNGRYIDSGASMHMTMIDDWFQGREQPQIKDIVVANNKRIPVIATGNVDVKVMRSGCAEIVPVSNVKFVPDLSV